MSTYEITPAQLVKTRREISLISSPALNMAGLLKVTDAVSYSTADDLLRSIRTARKTIELKLNPIIDPIRSGLDLLYTLRREMDGPLEDAEKQVKFKMRTWQLAEARKQAEEAAAQRLEAEKLRAEALAKQQKAEKTKNKLIAERISDEAAFLAEAADMTDAAAERTAEAKPTQAPSSSVRAVKKVTVTSLTMLLKGIADGIVPEDVVVIDHARLNKYWREDPETVRTWLGIEVIDDIVIAGR